MIRHVPRLVGLVFLYSAVSKLIDPWPTRVAVSTVFHYDSVPPLLTVLVTSLELYLAVFLWRRDNRAAVVTAMITLAVFSVFLWYLSMLANPPSCGCGRLFEIFSSNRKNALFGLVRNVALFFALLKHHESRHGSTLALKQVA